MSGSAPRAVPLLARALIAARINQREPGETITIDLVREGKALGEEVTLATRPA